jgi:hypothetical protein
MGRVFYGEILPTQSYPEVATIYDLCNYSGTSFRPTLQSARLNL